ncbi:MULTISPECIES: hypothetical protein [Brevibacillus]|jgi:hypothetical protein|uniref:hypothetical protein n=1 Tax=Brevibacillus TaxID=55080 RepID=UPI000D0FF6D3|nr:MULTISPECIES: hypothetical protein [Brevibacillus]PSJ64968.1 hypothetical protein C7J99_30220 [Brevibacillus brevis]RED29271.1 hypothetical protein DES34_10656 [Brevibacillus brevis]TQK62513.1 hypothetical protein FB479_105296 [Brevibacillus sp. AG162]VEF87872.1 Uncharacterised protein [Brevibacillus brevis]GEC92561.1 hypothetical protein BBR01nite_48920 [Brevibacillus brevis]
MPSPINTDSLKKAEVSTTLAKNMITQAIEQSAANPQLAEEALKQASQEIAQAQTMVSQVQSTLQTQAQAQQSKS